MYLLLKGACTAVLEIHAMKNDYTVLPKKPVAVSVFRLRLCGVHRERSSSPSSLPAMCPMGRSILTCQSSLWPPTIAMPNWCLRQWETCRQWLRGREVSACLPTDCVRNTPEMTLPSGKPANQGNQGGQALGGRGGLAGTLSALSWHGKRSHMHTCIPTAGQTIVRCWNSTVVQTLGNFPLSYCMSFFL